MPVLVARARALLRRHAETVGSAGACGGSGVLALNPEERLAADDLLCCLDTLASMTLAPPAAATALSVAPHTLAVCAAMPTYVRADLRHILWCLVLWHHQDGTLISQSAAYPEEEKAPSHSTCGQCSLKAIILGTHV